MAKGIDAMMDQVDVLLTGSTLFRVPTFSGFPLIKWEHRTWDPKDVPAQIGPAYLHQWKSVRDDDQTVINADETGNWWSMLLELGFPLFGGEGTEFSFAQVLRNLGTAWEQIRARLEDDNNFSVGTTGWRATQRWKPGGWRIVNDRVVMGGTYEALVEHAVGPF